MEELKAIAVYIAKNYESASKIVEACVGETTAPAAELKRLLPNSKLLIVDLKRPSSVPDEIEFLKDDVTNPDLSIYKGADLIYSLRAPFELYESLLDIARKTGADLILKSVTDEEVPEKGELINYHGVPFYLFKQPIS